MDFVVPAPESVHVGRDGYERRYHFVRNLETFDQFQGFRVRQFLKSVFPSRQNFSLARRKCLARDLVYMNFPFYGKIHRPDAGALARAAGLF